MYFACGRVGQLTTNLPFAAYLHCRCILTLLFDAVLSCLLTLAHKLTAQDRQAQNKDKRKRLAAALESGQRIIIDLDFADLMTDQVTRHLHTP